MAGTKISALSELGAGGLASGDFFVVVDTDVGTTKKIDADNILDVISTAFTRTLLDDSTAAAFMTTLGISAFAQTLLDDANAAAILNTLALDADLATFSLPANTTISAFTKTLLDDADAEAARATLVVQETSPKNFIINGDFNIAQRGATFTSIANGAYSLDRWRYIKTGAVVHDITQDSTSVPLRSQSGWNSKYALKMNPTTGDAAIAAGDITAIEQRIEGYRAAGILEGQVTLSFWVRSATTGIHCVAFVNASNTRSYCSEYTINVADNWEKKTVTVTFDNTGGTWNSDHLEHFKIRWTLQAGTTYHCTTADTWEVGNFYATSNQVNAAENVGDTFYLSQVQLEFGEAATKFTPNGDYSYQLLECARYYQRLNKVDANSRAMLGVLAPITTTISAGGIAVLIEMRAQPTIGGIKNYLGNASSIAPNAPVAIDDGSNGNVQFTDTGHAAMVVNEVYIIRPNLSSDSPTYMYLDAEL